MTSLVAKSPDYSILISDLRTMMAEGQQAALSAVNEIRLKTYWGMGKRLAQEKLLADENPDSGNFTNQVAADLQVDKALIYRVIQFYKLWPTAVPRFENTPALSWTHIVELLSMKDDAERQFYFETASKENWGRATLRKAIQKDLFETSKLSDGSQNATPLKRDDNPLYVYRAIVENVIDGDTLLVRVDLGFEVWVNQRIRLRGINTAELTKNGVPIANATERAKQAKVFVQDKLKDIPFIVIKTYKTDLYGRYIADVFYHPTLTKKEDVATKGFFLNAELVKSGLADLTT